MHPGPVCGTELVGRRHVLRARRRPVGRGRSYLNPIVAPMLTTLIFVAVVVLIAAGLCYGIMQPERLSRPRSVSTAQPAPVDAPLARKAA